MPFKSFAVRSESGLDLVCHMTTQAQANEGYDSTEVNPFECACLVSGSWIWTSRYRRRQLTVGSLHVNCYIPVYNGLYLCSLPSKTLETDLKGS